MKLTGKTKKKRPTEVDLFSKPSIQRGGGTGLDGGSVFAGDIFDIGPVDPQIIEIAVGQNGQFTNRGAIHGPTTDTFDKSVNDNHDILSRHSGTRTEFHQTCCIAYRLMVQCEEGPKVECSYAYFAWYATKSS